MPEEHTMGAISKSSGSLRQRLHAATAEAMLDSAERAMVRHGYEKATMQQIAAETGCAAGTFYLYFKNKRVLLEAIVARHMKAMFDHSRRAMGTSADPLEKLRLTLVATFRYAREHAGVFQFVFTAMPLRHRALHERLGRIGREDHDSFERLVIDLVREGQDKGVIRGDLPAQTLHEFMDAVAFSFIEQFAFSSRRQSVQDCVRVLWGLITGGLVHREGRA
jgi:AcrR family transcriptional regulator